MFEALRSKGRQISFAVADRTITSALVRWTWGSFGEQQFEEVLTDYRPTDIETVHEMMSGRYLMASRLVDTDGVSPFSIETNNAAWLQELHGFSWLRHFREARDAGERRFARTLVIDWIGRYGGFNARVWHPALTACRLLNWLRHYSLLIEDANDEQQRAIDQMLAKQAQSLRTRRGTTHDPVAQLLGATALLGAALSDHSEVDIVNLRRKRLEDCINQQFDADGLHKSRNPARQIVLMTELVTVRQGLSRKQGADAGSLGILVDRMHKALASLTLGTGEPGYFNGCGQQQSDLVYALQAQGAAQRLTSGTLGGYGILSAGRSLLIGDSGRIPEPEFSRQAHAGALSFEFSHGHELVLGNCGPAPVELSADADLFRRGLAHSCPTLDGRSAARVLRKGPHAGCLAGDNDLNDVLIDEGDVSMKIRTGAFERRFGYEMERWLTLIGDGDTLVGQDRFSARRNQTAGRKANIRFHLGPGVQVDRDDNEDIFTLTLPSGIRWSFLWEGASASLDDSVRQSAHIGFHRTRQIVLESDLRDGLEVAWILTRID